MAPKRSGARTPISRSSSHPLLFSLSLGLVRPQDCHVKTGLRPAGCTPGSAQAVLEKPTNCRAVPWPRGLFTGSIYWPDLC